MVRSPLGCITLFVVTSSSPIHVEHRSFSNSTTENATTHQQHHTDELSDLEINFQVSNKLYHLIICTLMPLTESIERRREIFIYLINSRFNSKEAANFRNKKKKEMRREKKRNTIQFLNTCMIYHLKGKFFMRCVNNNRNNMFYG